MPRAFSTITFTAAVRAAQEQYGSRQSNRRFEEDSEARNVITERERTFVAGIDTFFMSSVGANGWPYVQHRGGPRGFLKVLDEHTLGFADYAGNRQYISAGNLTHDDRIMLIIMDFAHRRRLKVWGRARIIQERDEPQLLARLHMPGYRARVERGYIITVQALDFNCPQHITARYTEEELFALSDTKDSL